MSVPIPTYKRKYTTFGKEVFDANDSLTERWVRAGYGYDIFQSNAWTDTSGLPVTVTGANFAGRVTHTFLLTTLEMLTSGGDVGLTVTLTINGDVVASHVMSANDVFEAVSFDGPLTIPANSQVSVSVTGEGIPIIGDVSVRFS